jgi:hypothetical protein
MFIFSKTKTQILLAGFIFLLLPFFVGADTQGQRTNFFIAQSFDIKGREKILAVLENVSLKGYFYLESDWEETLSEDEKKTINQNLEILGQEFDNTIYPKLTAAYGSPWEPGIDNSYNITVLFHKMKDGAAGYFNDGDEYPKIQNPKSNEREMIYLNADYLKFPAVKGYLAHEFVHLITFNQKDKERGVREEVWLNEARADFAPTLLGYDIKYQGSNLQQRVNQFVNSPSDSLTEWQAEKKDYGIVNIFIQYLVDNYGIRILADSLKSKKTGIESINEALNKAGFKKNFSQIFTDWTIAVFLADCNAGSNYCYKNENLKNLKVAPSLIFLPSTQKTSIFLDYSIKQWSGNWYRIIGGKGDLELDFDGEDSVDFKVAYVLCKDSELCQIKFLELDGQKKGKLSLENFGKNWSSLNLIPSIQSKVSGFLEQEPLYHFSISASIKIKTERELLVEELTAKIAGLQAQIAQLRAALSEISDKRPGTIPDGFSFEKNLSFSMTDSDVAYLKIILDKEVSHQTWSGNGYFGKSALAAVKLFQEKYKNEISQFSGYPIQASGFVGKGTRAKLNQIMRNF